MLMGARTDLICTSNVTQMPIKSFRGGESVQENKDLLKRLGHNDLKMESVALLLHRYSPKTL